MSRSPTTTNNSSTKAEWKRQQVASNIYLYTIHENKPIRITYVIAIYYEKNVHLSLTKQNFDVDAFKLAIQLPILKYGDKEELGENSGVFFYSYKAKCGWGASFLVNNTSNANYVITMDCTGSINTLSYSLKRKRSTSVMQKSRKVIQHFIPAEHALWSLTYQNKWEKTKFGL